jgi:hypothetical protein
MGYDAEITLFFSLFMFWGGDFEIYVKNMTSTGKSMKKIQEFINYLLTLK